ncbi:hypothetical protein LJC64_05030, partial [Ruminococcaceae bacterium OttesenSCG-928-A11]|nr:hypothetical protein [Ruminococcaceae bacterium OttesenSCG-928-A11]
MGRFPGRVRHKAQGPVFHGRTEGLGCPHEAASQGGQLDKYSQSVHSPATPVVHNEIMAGCAITESDYQLGAKEI